MGLMDRDYWRDKHNPDWDRGKGRKVDLSGLQRGVDAETRRMQRRSDGVAPTLWRALAWVVVAVVLFVILRGLGIGRH